jgi:hypothetical protein
VLGIVQTVLSCGVNLLFGALGATYAFMGRAEWAKGQHDLAMKHLKLSKIFNIIGFVVFGFLALAVVIFRAVTGSSSGGPFY